LSRLQNPPDIQAMFYRSLHYYLVFFETPDTMKNTKIQYRC